MLTRSNNGKIFAQCMLKCQYIYDKLVMVSVGYINGLY